MDVGFLHETLADATARLARQLNNRLREALAPHGLMPAQFAALAEIATDEGLSQKTLVERLDVEQPGVARTLGGLEDGGWIVRQSLGAGRLSGLHLTEKAREALPGALAAAKALDGVALSGLSRTERANLTDQLAELAQSLKQR